MFSTFFSFEIKAWLRLPMPWIFLFVFTLMTFSATVSDDVQIGGSYGNVWKNAPFVAQNWYVVFYPLAIARRAFLMAPPSAILRTTLLKSFPPL